MYKSNNKKIQKQGGKLPGAHDIFMSLLEAVKKERKGLERHQNEVHKKQIQTITLIAKMTSDIEERRNEMTVGLDKISANSQTGLSSDFLLDHKVDPKSGEENKRSIWAGRLD